LVDDTKQTTFSDVIRGRLNWLKQLHI
jgi:hypothetical protein